MPERPKWNIDEKNLAESVKNLPSVGADADFRARLRSEFADGRIAAGHAEEPMSRRERPLFGWWHWVVPVAAAAALLVVMVNLNHAPDLRVLRTKGGGEVRVGGSRIALSDIPAIEAAVAAGGEIDVPADALMDFMAENVLLLEVAGGTRMTVPGMPGRWFARAAACSLFAGEMRIKTGRNFPGNELVVFTPEGRVAITGTMLSIQRDEGGTCVCVLEGVARVGVDEDDMQPVEPGFRKVMLRDGTAEKIPILPAHREGVLDFDRRLGDRIAPSDH